MDIDENNGGGLSYNGPASHSGRSREMLVCLNCRITNSIYTLLISRGAILNIKFMTSFTESNLSYVGSMSRAMSSVLVHLVSCDKSHSSCSCCPINPHTNYMKERHNCDHLSLIKRLSSQFHLG